MVEKLKKKFTLLTAVINENKKPVLIFNNKGVEKFQFKDIIT